MMSDKTVNFGDFSLDICDGLLYRAGERVRIRPQAAHVLLQLVEHRGELVSRRDLTRDLWADPRINEHQGLNAIIRHLRRALDDDSTHPKYIETVPTKGYRFIASCSNDEDGSATRSASSRPLRIVVAMSVVVLIAIGVFSVRGPTTHPVTLGQIPSDARQSYAEGLKRYQQPGSAGVEISRPKFRNVVASAPEFAEGHLFLGKSLVFAKGANLELAVEAEPHIREALRLNPELPDGYVALGRIALIKDLDPVVAAEFANKALELDARSTEALELMSEIRLLLRDPKGALDYLDQVNNTDALRMSDTARRGWIHLFGREYELAMRECRNALRVNTYNPYASLCLIEAYLGLGALELARQQAAINMRVYRAPRSDVQIVETAEVREAIEAFWSWRVGMVEAREKTSGDLYPLMLLHWRLGNPDKAVDLLNTLVEERHYASLLRLSVDTRMEPLLDHAGLEYSFEHLNLHSLASRE